MTNEELITKLIKKVYEQDRMLNSARIQVESIYDKYKKAHKFEDEKFGLMHNIIDLSNELGEKHYLCEDE